MIKSDEQRIMQIILNLMSNAIKFTVEGFVKVHVMRKDEDFLLISVSDSGIGILKENQGKLFKLFGFLNDTSYLNKQGVGLGLTICKSIIQQLEGDVWID